MKITIKNIKGEVFQLDVEPTAKIAEVKAKIQQEKGMDAASQKLILKGKNTEDEQTLDQLGVKEGDFMIVMVSKKPAGVQPSTQPTTQTETKPQTENKPVQETQSQPQGSNASGTVSDNASALLVGEQLNKTIDEICNMGFPRDQVVQAMKAAFNNPDRAIEYLFNGIPTEPQGNLGGFGGFGGFGQGGNVGVQTGQATNQNNQGDQQENPLAFLASNPMFHQLRAAVQENPELLQAALAQLAQTNPQLFQTITQNQEAFLQLLMGGGEEGDEYDEGNLPPNVISVTPEEKAAIDRICALGFDRSLAIEAYFSCDKNEEMAVNYCIERQMEEGYSGDHGNLGEHPGDQDDYEDDNLFQQ